MLCCMGIAESGSKLGVAVGNPAGNAWQYGHGCSECTAGFSALKSCRIWMGLARMNKPKTNAKMPLCHALSTRICTSLFLPYVKEGVMIYYYTLARKADYSKD